MFCSPSHRAGWRRLITVIVVLPALLLTGCGGNDQDESTAEPLPSPSDTNLTGGLVEPGKTSTAAPTPAPGGGAAPAPQLGDITEYPANCAPAGTVHFGGSNGAGNAMRALLRGYNANCPTPVVAYSPSNSTEGLRRFTTKEIPLAVTDAVPTEAERKAGKARCADDSLMATALATSPVAVVYNLPGVPNLRLGATAITAIFRGAVTSWDDPIVATDNPGVRLPKLPVTAVHRSDSSGTTEVFSFYLAGGAGDAWEFAPGRVWSAPGGKAVTSSEEMAGLVSRTPGAIGYVQLSYANAAKLPAAAMYVGESWVKPTAQTVKAAVEQLQREEDGLKLWPVPYASESDNSYPLLSVTYAVSCGKGLPSDQAAATTKFLEFATGAAGQKSLAETGYFAAPKQG